jgi:hypothetical protein
MRLNEDGRKLFAAPSKQVRRPSSSPCSAMVEGERSRKASGDK